MPFAAGEPITAKITVDEKQLNT